MSKKISIVCPVYNEALVIEQFFQRSEPILKTIASEYGITYEYICIDDGSTDDTVIQLQQQQQTIDNIVIIKLSRNFGKEAALTAGIDHATGDAVIPIDADLQDPPELIHDMVNAWLEGYDVVLAKRIDRSSDSVLKRITSRWFYKIHNMISDMPIPEQVGDYRLMSRKVVDVIKLMPESQRFMKGLFAWVGFRTTALEYTRVPRDKGSTKFSGWKLWNLALDGITGYSTALLKVWTYLGLLVASSAFIYGLIIIFKALILGIDAPGYSSLMSVILFLGGLNMVGLGILGEYIGRIYAESKKRPIYIVDEAD